jgi:hypothetical protein
MWARTTEVMLAMWLAVSPFVFRHPPGERSLWGNDLACALLVATLSLLSFRRSLGRAHLGNLAVGLWLVGVGYVGAHPEPVPASQNHAVLGLVLLMLAIVPSRATEPPPAWQGFYAERPPGG